MYKYELLHYTRKNKKISLDELAKKLGISKSYLSLIEKGSRKLSYDLAVKIAEYLETTPDELFLDDHTLSIKENNN
ncbi:putative transcriptional regulator [Bacilli bacterium PM5-3]|nr:putative transcriptional regulator [Bacilli bacterium PM5-3]MDH6603090.1 putative transcriptional regulator [Bacilli bacterium PM5-9]